jgi:hypothetical protein
VQTKLSTKRETGGFLPLSAGYGLPALMSEARKEWIDPMADEWQRVASTIGATLIHQARKHPELRPLVTSWVNFCRKRRCLPHPTRGNTVDLANMLEPGLVLVRIDELTCQAETIRRQSDEIAALEYRIKTLMES